ncbi:MAG TPA: DUF87 domain-containing protein [Limnochordales bacterium]
MLGLRRKQRKAAAEEEQVTVSLETDESGGLAENVPRPLDLLAPDVIDRSDIGFVRVGRSFAQTHTLIAWPRYVMPGWFTAWLQLPFDVDTSIYIEPIEGRVARDALSRQQVRLQSRLKAELQSGEIKERELLQQTIEDIQRLRTAIQAGTTNLYAVSVLTTIYAKSREALDVQMEELIKAVERAGFHGRICDAQHDLGVLATMPQGILPDRIARRRNLDADALATLFPFVAGDLAHPEGVYFGLNVLTGAPILYDQFHSSLNNHNVLVYAEAGAGKSTTVKTAFIGRSLLMGRHVVVIDPEGEYRKVAEALGGTYIELGRSHYVLNPFDVSPDRDEHTGELHIDLETKVADIIGLIEAMLEGDLQLSNVQKGALEHLIWKLYADFGITEDPRSILAPADQDEDVVSLSPDGGARKPMPTLSDFHRLIVQEAEHQPRLKEVAEALQRYLRTNPTHGWLDGQTTVPIDQSDFVVFSLAWIGDRDWTQKALALYVCLSWTWERFIKRPRGAHKICIVDEAWQLADHERTFEFLERVVRRCRKRDAGLVVIAQDAWKFLGERCGEAIHNNCSTQVFLKQGATNLNVLRDQFHLPGGIVSLLNQLEKGEGILLVGGRPYWFRNEVNPLEARWAFTSRTT